MLPKHIVPILKIPHVTPPVEEITAFFISITHKTEIIFSIGNVVEGINIIVPETKIL